jgi:hypothetical protein
MVVSGVVRREWVGGGEDLSDVKEKGSSASRDERQGCRIGSAWGDRYSQEWPIASVNGAAKLCRP